MRKLLTWIVVTVGVAALVRKLRRRGQEPSTAEYPQAPTEPTPAEPAPPAAASDDPADELRRKLATTRDDDESAAGVAEPSVEERRAEVHDEGRSAIDEMRQSAEDKD